MGVIILVICNYYSNVRYCLTRTTKWSYRPLKHEWIELTILTVNIYLHSSGPVAVEPPYQFLPTSSNINITALWFWRVRLRVTVPLRSLRFKTLCDNVTIMRPPVACQVHVFFALSLNCISKKSIVRIWTSYFILWCIQYKIWNNGKKKIVRIGISYSILCCK